MKIQEGEEIPLLRLLPLAHRLLSASDIRNSNGLTKSQIIILLALQYKKSLHMSQIAEYITSSKEQATRAVTGLVDNGLAERYELAENRTHVYLRLTPEGEDRIGRFREKAYENLKIKLDGCLSEEEKEQLEESVNTVITLLNKVR